MSSLKIGCPLYATDQGIGILAKAFHDHGLITHPLIIAHGKHPTHQEWYPNAPIVYNLSLSFREWARELDVLLCIETPFDWSLYSFCREHKIRTVHIPMYECTQPSRFKSPIDCPNLFICPSALDLRYFENLSTTTPAIFLPLPVEVPHRLRTKAEVFVHNAGHGGLLGRNGTAEFMEALRYVRSMAQFILRSQTPIDKSKLPYDGDRVDIRVGNLPYDSLFADGDVFVFPDKFSGQSCPLEEARASGMLVMGSDRFPHNTYLPNNPAGKCDACDGDGSTMYEWAKATMLKCGGSARSFTDGRPGVYYVDAQGREMAMKTIGGDCSVCNGSGLSPAGPLIPVSSYRKNRIGTSFFEFDEAVVDPRDIARTIDDWYGRDITAYSSSGRIWAELRSWNRLGNLWLEQITGVVS